MMMKFDLMRTSLNRNQHHIHVRGRLQVVGAQWPTRSCRYRTGVNGKRERERGLYELRSLRGGDEIWKREEERPTAVKGILSSGGQRDLDQQRTRRGMWEKEKGLKNETLEFTMIGWWDLGWWRWGGDYRLKVEIFEVGCLTVSWMTWRFKPLWETLDQILTWSRVFKRPPPQKRMIQKGLVLKLDSKEQPINRSPLGFTAFGSDSQVST